MAAMMAWAIGVHRPALQPDQIPPAILISLDPQPVRQLIAIVRNAGGRPFLLPGPPAPPGRLAALHLREASITGAIAAHSLAPSEAGRAASAAASRSPPFSVSSSGKASMSPSSSWTKAKDRIFDRLAFEAVPNRWATAISTSAKCPWRCGASP